MVARRSLLQTCYSTVRTIVVLDRPYVQPVPVFFCSFGLLFVPLPVQTSRRHHVLDLSVRPSVCPFVRICKYDILKNE